MDEKEEKAPNKRFVIVPVDPKRYPRPYINPWIRLFIYISIVFFTGTLYMGWNGYQTLLYKAGAFEELCDNATDISSVKVGNEGYVDCGSRKAAINNLYTIAFSTHLLSSVLTGIVFDHLGPKILFMFGQFVQFLMWILISTMPKNRHVLRVSFFFIGLTSESLIMPLMTISYYFPQNQSLIISFLGATRSLSFMVPIILSKIFEIDFFKPHHLYIIGISYGCIGNLTSFLIGSVIVPKRFIKVSEYSGSPSVLSPTEKEIESEREVKNDEYKTLSSKIMLVKSRARTAINHPQFVEYIILVLVSSLYLASVEFISKSQRELLLCSDGSTAIHLFKYIHVLTFAPGPLMGFLVDKIGPGFVLLILHSSCFLYYFFVSFDYFSMKIIACLFYLFSCSMLISHIYCYISKRFYLKNFGRLVGFCFFSAGLFVTINIPLYNFMTNRSSVLDTHNLKIVTRIFMGYMVSGFALCLILIYFTTKKMSVPVHLQKEES